MANVIGLNAKRVLDQLSRVVIIAVDRLFEKIGDCTPHYYAATARNLAQARREVLRRQILQQKLTY